MLYLKRKVGRGILVQSILPDDKGGGSLIPMFLLFFPIFVIPVDPSNSKLVKVCAAANSREEVKNYSSHSLF